MTTDGSADDRSTPLGIAVGYVVFGVLWILVTDAVTAVMLSGPDSTLVQLAKGLTFVAGSAAFVYVTLRRRESLLSERQSALRAASQRFESIVRASPVPIVALDGDGRIELWNEAAADTFGWREAEVLGKRVADVWDHEATSVRENVERALDGERHAGLEVTRRTKSGEAVEVSLSTAPIRDESGDVTGIMAVLVDVTEREARERNLLRYRRLMENLPVGIARARPAADGTIEAANPRMAAMLDADSEAALLDRTLADLFQEEATLSALLSEFAETGRASAEARLRTLEGDTIWAKITAIRHETDDGEVFADGIVMDVTDRKDRERQLKVVDRLLRHNFRNEMGAIMGYAELMAAGAEGETAEYADQILDAAAELLESVETEREIVEILVEPQRLVAVEVGAATERAVAAVGERHPEASLSVAIEDQVHVEALAEVERAVRELVGNAVVHSDRPHPEVEVTVRTRGGAAEIEVADDGPGIPDCELEVLTGERAIEPLSHGSGLGMWLVNWIVRRSGGSLAFAPNDPRGSVVTVRLPGAESHPRTAVDEPSAPGTVETPTED